MANKKQVFYDPTGKRWKVSITIGVFFSFIIFSLLSLTINNIFQIYSINSSIRGLSYDGISSRNIDKEIVTNYSYTFEEFVHYKENFEKIDRMFFNAARPSLEENQISLVTKSGEEVDRINTFIADNSPSLQSVLQISDINYDKKYYEFRDNSFVVSTLVNNTDYHNDFVESLNNYYQNSNFSGLSLSLRKTTIQDIEPELFESLLESIKTNLGNDNFYLSISSDSDFSKLNQIIQSDLIDQLVIQIDPNQSVFANTKSLDQLKEEVESVVNQFNNTPISLMIASDNALFTSREGNLVSNQSIPYFKIGEIISEYNLKVNYNQDDPSKLHYLEYSQNDFDFKIVLNDSVFTYNLLRELSPLLKQNIIAIGLSDLGFEDPISWSIINSNRVAEQKELLSALKFNTYIDGKGEGDIIIPSADPLVGQRNIVFKNNFAVSQEFETLPQSAQVYFTQADSQSVALTFDDGPDPVYTPQILDILNEYDVKATFFVVGQNVAKYPELTNRIAQEGHIIGNHTYTHPKTYNLSPEVLAEEVSTTQAIIQEVTGVTPKYFRIPFSDSSSIDTERDLLRYKVAQDQGLISSEYNVDSKDWLLADTSKILDKVFSYDLSQASQILLHDGGGDRQTTIEALPQIIEEFQDQGIDLVTVDTVARTETPIPAIQDSSLSLFSQIGYFFQNVLTSFVSAYLLLFFVFAIARYLLVWFLNLLHFFTRTSPKYSAIEKKPLVSVLIACYNEENSIHKTVQSVLDSQYHNIEILVIDDGSKDKTLKILQDNFSKNSKVRIISIPNGGKAKAINYGLKLIKGEYVLSIDADTLIYPQTIENLLKQFKPNVGAVAGNIQVGNDNNFLTKNQRLEYITGQNFDKVGYQAINSIIVIPGALGMWRVKSVQEAGSYQTDTLAEDADLTIRLIRQGWKILYTSQAIAVTEAPDRIDSFIKQRVRWMYGTLQVIFKHRDMLFNKKYGWFGFVIIPEFILTYFFLPVTLVSNLILLFVISKVITLILGFDVYFGAFFENNPIIQTIILFFIFIALYYATIIVAISRDKSEQKWRLLLYVPFSIIIYRQAVWLINIWVIIKAVKGRKALWNHFEKKGKVKLLTSQEKTSKHKAKPKKYKALQQQDTVIS